MRFRARVLAYMRILANDFIRERVGKCVLAQSLHDVKSGSKETLLLIHIAAGSNPARHLVRCGGVNLLCNSNPVYTWSRHV